jgi:hypothetical protein
MKRKALILIAISLICFGNVAGQSQSGNLTSWVGKYPTDRKGKVTRSFFRLPEIRQPLLKLLSKHDFALLTKEYEVETPIKQIGDYLVVKVCRPHNCGDEQAGFAIKLSDGTIHVRMHASDEIRWFSSKGKYRDLPREVYDYLEDFSAT